MMWYTKWKAKRQLKKTAKLVKLVIDNLPSSSFRNLIQKADGTFMEPPEAMTRLWQIADMMERQ
jgi:hypothetical protein